MSLSLYTDGTSLFVATDVQDAMTLCEGMFDEHNTDRDEANWKKIDDAALITIIDYTDPKGYDKTLTAAQWIAAQGHAFLTTKTDGELDWIVSE